MSFSRFQRRRRARLMHGVSLGEFKRRQKQAADMEAAALAMPPEDARKLLATWAAQPGRTQAEVDALNRDMGAMKNDE